jgi:hypothetical protein
VSSRVVLPAAAIVGLIAVPGSWLWLHREAAPSSPPVARVNGSAITERDLAIRLSELLPAASFHGHIAPEKLLALRRTALDELVFEELALREAHDTGRSPDQDEVEREVAQVRERFASDEAFDEAIASFGLSRRAFRRHMERAVLFRKTAVANTPPDPTEAEAASYYEAHSGKFLRPEQVHLREILVAVDPAGGRPAERAASAKVKALTRALKSGTDFGTLAWEESQDAYRVKHGDLGWVHRGRLDPDLESAVFAAPVGALGTTRSLAGFHLFEVVARQPEQQLTFEEAKPLIMDRLRRQRREAADKAWHERLHLGARIEILDEDLAWAEPLEIPPLNLSPWGRGSAAPLAAPSH